jgi:hypothetical protein
MRAQHACGEVRIDLDDALGDESVHKQNSLPRASFIQYLTYATP